MTSPFDRSQPSELETGAWTPLIDGITALSSVVEALGVVVERLTALVDELRQLVAGRGGQGPLARKVADTQAADQREQDSHQSRHDR